MKKFLSLDPVYQTGHNCKITAIATIERYFSKQIGFPAIPLHKGKKNPISIRKLAKMKGSLQGELLEIRQLSEILEDLGYETEIVDAQGKPETFKSKIVEHINQGNLMIGFFAVELGTSELIAFDEYNEHAAILHGFWEPSGLLDLTHWGKHFLKRMDMFYNSSMTLPMQRLPEYYVNIKNRNPYKKYDLAFDQTGGDPQSIRSLIPKPNTGFRAQLVVVKKPSLERIQFYRDKLLSPLPVRVKNTMTKILSKIDTKIDELIRNGNKNPHYKAVKKIAEQLQKELNEAKNRYLKEDGLDLAALKQACETAIHSAQDAFGNHRGWHQINIVLRAFLGILAILFILPALLVATTTKHGYQGTFFKTPKTDAKEKLDLFKQELQEAIDEFEPQIAQHGKAI